MQMTMIVTYERITTFFTMNFVQPKHAVLSCKFLSLKSKLTGDIFEVLWNQ